MTHTWHIVTGEYPPVEGGVGDYVFSLSNELAQAGYDVHVWCPARAGDGLNQPYVTVHSAFKSFGLLDCIRVGRELRTCGMSRRLLVQWVPHAFGMRGANLPFCLWVLARSIAGRDDVELMVHEPFLRIVGSRKQRAAAIAQRLMMTTLLLASSRVWVSTPYWWTSIRTFALKRRVTVGWLPLPSNVALLADERRVAALREEVPDSKYVVGHFGLFGPGKDAYFIPYVEAILDRIPTLMFRLIGPLSTATRRSIVERRPDLGSRVVAVDGVPKDEAVCHLAACEMLVQPYLDGVSSRRTSLMAGLGLGIATVTHTAECTEPFWRTDKACYLADPTPEGYADAVACLISDPTARAELGWRAREVYDSRFHIRHVVDRLGAPHDPADPVEDDMLAEWESYRRQRPCGS